MIKDTPKNFFKTLEIEISYDGGNDAKYNSIDMYDLSVALKGLHRSIAIVSNFVATGNIVTRVPDIQDIKIIASIPEEGSYKYAAVVLFGMLGTPFLQSIDTPLGNIAWSFFEYVTHKTIGIRPTPEKSLYSQYIDGVKSKDIEKKADSLAIKIEPAIIDIHRPIFTGSASVARIVPLGEVRGKIDFNIHTYESLNSLTTDKNPVQFVGRVAGYNVNTERGVIYIQDENRAIPFHFDNINVETNPILESLLIYNQTKKNNEENNSGYIKFLAKGTRNNAGILKELAIVQIYKEMVVIR